MSGTRTEAEKSVTKRAAQYHRRRDTEKQYEHDHHRNRRGDAGVAHLATQKQVAHAVKNKQQQHEVGYQRLRK